MDRKKSVVWKFFEKVCDNEKLVMCIYCKNEYKHSGNTTNLSDHLIRKHLLELNETKMENSGMNIINAKERIQIKKPRKTRKNYQNRSNEYDRNCLKKKNLDKLFVEMIAMDMQPLRISENRGFKRFIHALDDKYELPSRSTLTSTLIPKYYGELKNELTLVLSQVDYVSISTDIWTSVSNEAILAVTGHLIRCDLISPLLKVVKLEGKHTAQNIAQTVNDILLEYQIRTKVVCMVTDNAPNMKKSAEILNIAHSPCFAHNLNLVVQDCFKIDKFMKILTKCKTIVSFFRSNTSANDALRAIQSKENKTELKLLKAVNTRWNSSYYMLKRICEVKNELRIALKGFPNCLAFLTAKDFKTIDEIVQLLEPFEVATTAISGENYVTSSLIIPLTRGILLKLSSFTTKVKSTEGRAILKSLQNSVNKRLKPYYSKQLTMLATILDPRFKTNGFQSSSEAENAVKLLENEYATFLSTQKANMITDVEQTFEKNSKVHELLFIIKVDPPSLEPPLNDVITEIDQYVKAPVIEMYESSLNYWKESNSSLQKIAQKYLCTPATSVPAERTFSKAGSIMTKKRNRLKSKRLNELLFLEQNHFLLRNK